MLESFILELEFWTLHSGFWFLGFLKLDGGCSDSGLWILHAWILVSGCWVLDSGILDSGSGLYCWILGSGWSRDSVDWILRYRAQDSGLWIV